MLCNYLITEEIEVEKIKFYGDDGEEVLFEIIDSSIVDGKKYILVVDDFDQAIILKETSGADDNLNYVIVEDDDEFQKIALLLMESDEYELDIEID